MHPQLPAPTAFAYYRICYTAPEYQVILDDDILPHLQTWFNYPVCVWRKHGMGQK